MVESVISNCRNKNSQAEASGPAFSARATQEQAPAEGGQALLTQQVTPGQKVPSQ